MRLEEYPGIWRYIIVIVSMLEVLCFSGIMYGWGALVYVLKGEGFLLELCSVNNRTLESDRNTTDGEECDARDARFNLYFTLISSIGVLLILIVGHTFTRFGTRTTRTVFITSFGLGCLCVAFADVDYPWLICVGGIFMIGSGYVFSITSTQFNMLFPGHSSTIVGLMNGMKVSSSFMQQLVKVAHDSGINRRIAYFSLFGLVCLTYLTTIFLYPKGILKDKEKTKEVVITPTLKGNTAKDQSKDVEAKCKDIGSESSSTEQQINGVYNSFDKSKPIETANGMINGQNSSTETMNGSMSKNENTESHLIKETQNVTIPNKFINGTLNKTGSLTPVEINNKVVKRTNNTFDNNGFVGEMPNGTLRDTKSNTASNDMHANVGNSVQLSVEDAPQFKESVNGSIVANGTTEPIQDRTEEEEDYDDVKLKDYMCGYLYIFNVLWFTVIRFRTNYFYGTINPFIEEVTDRNAEKVSYFTDILSYSMASGIFTCILVGVLYDWQRRFFSDIKEVKTRRVMSSVFPLITTCLVSVLLSSLVFVKDELVLYPLTIIFTFFRSLLTTVGNTFLVDMYPATIYGTIYGTRFVIANVFSLIQYALYRWSLAYHGAGTHVNVLVLCLCLTTFVHPVSILLSNRRKKKNTVAYQLEGL